MSKPVSDARVRCTYSDCRRIFRSVQEMKHHKFKEPEHDYCKTCDEDFEDEERLLIHKIKSNKHIVCPICGLDFKSEGGRDIHIRQNHRAEQSLTCCGCQAKFKSASGLMRHIEEDECPEIDRTRLIQEQSKKILIKEALKAGQGRPMPIIPEDKNDFDDIDGGVKLSPRELENREAMMNQPKPPRDDDDDDTASISTSAYLSHKHWPKLGGENSNENAPSHGTAPSDLMAFSELSVKDTTTGKDKGKEKADSTTPAKPESISGSKTTESWKRQDYEAQSKKKGTFGLEGLPDAGRTLRTVNENWDPTKFFNSYTGFYDCPCGSSFTSLKEFQSHVLKKTKGRKNVQCPSCFKMFKSTAALIAHCESPSTRCTINSSDAFGQIIDEISGGIIQANGYLPDGTVKYEAGQLELPPKPTAIGTDLGRADW